jgi:hypothetical protein
MTVFAVINTVASILVLLKENPYVVYLWNNMVILSDLAWRYMMGCKFEHQGEWSNYIFALNDKQYVTDIYYDVPEKPDTNINLFKLANLAIVRIKDMERLHRYRRGCYVVPKDVHIPMLLEAKRVESPVLSVQYNHPKVEPPISIEISDEYWFEGNELFSAAFVGRWLDYFIGPHIPFDTQYTLTLVVINEEADIEVITLGPTEYIRILEKGFEIRKLELESDSEVRKSNSSSSMDSESVKIE